MDGIPVLLDDDLVVVGGVGTAGVSHQAMAVYEGPVQALARFDNASDVRKGGVDGGERERKDLLLGEVSGYKFWKR